MSIQLKRGTSDAKSKSSVTLDAGQPFYETDTGKLYIAKADKTAIKDASLVNANDPDAAHLSANNTFTGTNNFNYLVNVTTQPWYGLWVTSDGSGYNSVELHPGNSSTDAYAIVKGHEINRYTQYQHDSIKLKVDDDNLYTLTLPSATGTLIADSDSTIVTKAIQFSNIPRFRYGLCVGTESTNQVQVSNDGVYRNHSTAYYIYGWPTKSGAIALTSDVAIQSSRDNTITDTAKNIFYGPKTSNSTYPSVEMYTSSDYGCIAVGSHMSDSSGNVTSSGDFTYYAHDSIQRINATNTSTSPTVYTLTYPYSSGTIALTSDIPSNIDLSISKALSTTSQSVSITSSNLAALRDTSSIIKTITLKFNTASYGSTSAAKYILYKAGIGLYSGTAGFGFMYIGFTENGKMIKLWNTQQDDDDVVNVMLV